MVLGKLIINILEKVISQLIVVANMAGIHGLTFHE